MKQYLNRKLGRKNGVSGMLLAAVQVLTIAGMMQPPLNAQWMQTQFDDTDMAADLDQALTFQKYPTYTQYVEMMQYFAALCPCLCRLDTFGTTVEGRALLALKISDNVEKEEPEARFLFTSTMHGDELVGFVLLMRLANFLLEGYGTDIEVTRLVDSLEIWINPLANPDGSYSADGGLSLENSVRLTAEGYDLNRNFPDPAKGALDDTTGRPLENRFMMQFMKEKGFTLSANLHSGAEVVNYPWDHTYNLHADDAWYYFISREYADEARAVNPDYMALFTDGVSNGALWYIINGGRQDYVNYYLEGREVTLELSDDYQLESERLQELWEINQRSFLNYMGQGMYGIRGIITDSETGDPLRARVEIPGHDSTYSVVHSRGDDGSFYRLIKEGNYDLVVSAPGYLNDTIAAVEVTDYEATWLEIGLERNTTGISAKEAEAPAVRIWPNPADDRFFLSLAGIPYGELSIQMIAVTGRVVMNRTLDWKGEVSQLPAGQFESGYYFIRIITSERVYTSSLIIR